MLSEILTQEICKLGSVLWLSIKSQFLYTELSSYLDKPQGVVWDVRWTGGQSSINSMYYPLHAAQDIPAVQFLAILV